MYKYVLNMSLYTWQPQILSHMVLPDLLTAQKEW